MSSFSTPLVIATHNPGKLREIAELLAPLGLRATSAGELGLPEPEETGDTFRANALLKAEAACTASGFPALADDSGLSIDILDGAPGIYSARWAGETKDFAIAMERITKEITAKGENPEGQPAQFVCALALCFPDGSSHIFEGIIRGRLTFPPRGTRGFGYDPIFIAEGEIMTFAEMEPAEKHAISHRAKAFAQFLAYLKTMEAA